MEILSTPKWTVRKKGEGMGCMVEGWKKEGHEEFAKLHQLVLEDRSSEHGKAFEQRFLQHQKEVDERQMEKRGQKRKAAQQRTDNVVYSVNLLDELVEQTAAV